MIKNYLKTLSKCVLFRGIGPAELNAVLECLKPKVNSYKKNDWVTLAGQAFDGLGIVLSGEIVVTRENAAGNRVIISVNGPGEIFGEIAAFSGEGVWPATVAARESCTVMFLPAGKIAGSCENSCSSHKQLIMNMLKIISDKALMLSKTVEYLSIKSIRGKISNFLLEQYQKDGRSMFMLPLKRDELADFLNVSRPSLSRELGRMRDEGVIEFHRSSVKILDLDALKRMAQ
ncbi:MAG: Crp/Fnr family transcriptional regulator [Pelotomaculum sp.]|uniref:cAMP-binding proteins n=1 Tax=Pelotomaculum thermopropionicum (strain DSM 13744 / JCM 10971 / SI) TaxID=370438 RepID=A5D485_PELTS|nr:Crp/Fnr family transcriptional regulator [Pelotomaculum sp.]BAF58962.1 cAMP-binding proteins [Pelotomaculum thermopropionicum SI]